MKIYSLKSLLCFLLITIPACNPLTSTQPSESSLPVPTNVPYHLGQTGPFKVGKHSFSVNDDSRGKYPVFITIWYPAYPSDGGMKDAKPDFSQAPYPVILSSTKMANTMASILVSHGFTWVSIDYIDTYMWMGKDIVSQPREILFGLDRVATDPPENLKGMFDTDHAGSIGYSFDGYNSLAMGGARIDPEYYLSQCPTPDATTAPFVGLLSSFSCNPAQNWDEFLSSIKGLYTVGEDDLWLPMTDERILAFMPMAPEGWWLFGQKGLASVDRPVLMIGSTGDSLYKEDALIFENLGSPDKTLITFVGKDHMMIYESEMVTRMAHFAVAFFSYHLKRMQDMAWYFSEDYVNQQSGLASGVVLDQ